jgi:hypothetical protein
MHSTSITLSVSPAPAPAEPDKRLGPGLAPLVDRIGGNPALACAQMARFLKRATGG